MASFEPVHVKPEPGGKQLTTGHEPNHIVPLWMITPELPYFLSPHWSSLQGEGDLKALPLQRRCPPERPQIELHSWGSCSSTKGGEDSGGDAKNILREVIVRHTRVWRCGTDKYTDMVGVGTQVGLWLGFVNVGYWVWLRVIVWACLCACI